jgi:hypothetical protein
VSLFVQGELSPLEIFSSDQTDTGEYRCTASNRAGNVEKTVSLFVQGELSPLEIFSSDQTDTGEYRCTASNPAILEAVHLYSPVSVRSELNISRGDNSPCTNNDTVFSTLPALVENSVIVCTR